MCCQRPSLPRKRRGRTYLRPGTGTWMPRVEHFQRTPCGARFQHCPLSEISTFRTGQQRIAARIGFGYWVLVSCARPFSRRRQCSEPTATEQRQKCCAQPQLPSATRAHLGTAAGRAGWPSPPRTTNQRRRRGGPPRPTNDVEWWQCQDMPAPPAETCFWLVLNVQRRTLPA
jgi:hypothetical protein